VSTSSDNLPAVEDEKPPTLPGVMMQLANLVFRRDAILWAAAVAVLLGAGGLGVVWAQDKLDGGVAPVKAALAEHIRDEAQARAALERKVDLAEERSARRFEVLYNAVLERRPQPGAAELAQPMTDGGR
jgi:hypothetical protein